MASDTDEGGSESGESQRSGACGRGHGPRGRGGDRGYGVTRGARGRGSTTSKVKIYGNTGKVFCCLCNCKRDHAAKQCPGNFCFRCKQKGHWRLACTAPYCTWCNEIGHKFKDCVAGGSQFIGAPAPESPVASGSGKRGASAVSGQPAPKVAATTSTGCLPAASRWGQQPNVGMPILGEVNSFLDRISAGSMSQESYTEQSSGLEKRKLEAQHRYEEEIKQLRVEQAKLDQEYENAQAYRQAIEQLAAVHQRIARSGSRPQPAPRTTVVNLELSAETQSLPASSVPVVKMEEVSLQVVQSVQTQLSVASLNIAEPSSSNGVTESNKAQSTEVPVDVTEPTIITELSSSNGVTGSNNAQGGGVQAELTEATQLVVASAMDTDDVDIVAEHVPDWVQEVEDYQKKEEG